MVLVEAHAGDRSGSATPTGTPRAGTVIRDMLARGRVEGRDALAPTASWMALGRRLPQPRPPRPRLDGDRCSRHRPLGSEGATARASARDAARRGARSGADLRQRRLHLLPRRSALAEQLARLGRAGDPAREDEGRTRARARPRPGRGRARGDRCGRRALRRCQRRALAASRRSGFAVRVLRSASPCAGSRSRSPPTTSTGCACSATGPGRAWRSPPASTATCSPYFEAMLAAGAVDCLQADVTRCEGITGFLRVAALCQARSLQLSAHCGPSIHAHPCCAVVPLRHLEYFHDHVADRAALLRRRARARVDGALRPDLSRPGNGLELKRADAARVRGLSKGSEMVPIDAARRARWTRRRTSARESARRADAADACRGRRR